MNRHGLDGYVIEAYRYGALEPVAEPYVFGPKAKELLARGLITEAQRQQYRGFIRRRMIEAYKLDLAERKLAELDAHHAASERAHPPKPWGSAFRARPAE